MNSNGWKLALTAPLIMVMMTACGDKKKKDSVSTSAYAGIWVDYNAYESLQASPAAFCGYIRSNPHVVALHVESDGRVLNYNPGLRGADRQYRDSYFWGHVRGDRFKSRYSQGTQAVGFDPRMYRQQGQRIRLSEDTRFIRRQNSLTLWDRMNGQSHYALVTEQQAEHYTMAAAECLRGQGGQMVVPVQPMPMPQQPMGPPPGYGQQPPMGPPQGPQQGGQWQEQQWNENQPPFDDQDADWKGQPQGPQSRK